MYSASMSCSYGGSPYTPWDTLDIRFSPDQGYIFEAVLLLSCPPEHPRALPQNSPSKDSKFIVPRKLIEYGFGYIILRSPYIPYSIYSRGTVYYIPTWTSWVELRRIPQPCCLLSPRLCPSCGLLSWRLRR